MSAEKLYTPDLLAATMELAKWPAVETLPLHGDARSATCGSTLAMDIETDAEGRIHTFGMRVRACAVGQAAAAIFARHALGRSRAELQKVHDRMEGWLQDEAPAPEWEDLSLIEPAKAYPGRHGAIMLPWKAALDALSSQAATS